jgi:3-methylfumaryl-CoA hydratase
MTIESLPFKIGATHRNGCRVNPIDVQTVNSVLGLPLAPLQSVAPAGYHWLAYQPVTPMTNVGPDGHSHGVGVLPDMRPLRRMWAGSRVRLLAPLPIGVELTNETEVVQATEKQGRSGRLVFATLRHTLCSGETVCVEEEQDIVYREPMGGAPSIAPAATAAVENGEQRFADSASFDAVRLFRFSAATLNSHRIHYDAAYAREMEGYAGLVVHGPLLALLMLTKASATIGPSTSIAGFSFKGVAPSFVDDQLHVGGAAGDRAIRMWTSCGGALRATAQVQLEVRK